MLSHMTMHWWALHVPWWYIVMILAGAALLALLGVVLGWWSWRASRY